MISADPLLPRTVDFLAIPGRPRSQNQSSPGSKLRITLWLELSACARGVVPPESDRRWSRPGGGRLR
jgi:hypothetical protein